MVILTDWPTIAVPGELSMVGEFGALLDSSTMIVRLIGELPLPLMSKVVAQMVCVPAAENVKVAVVLAPPVDHPDT
jgi:hypothetical protein